MAVSELGTNVQLAKHMVHEYWETRTSLLIHTRYLAHHMTLVKSEIF